MGMGDTTAIAETAVAWGIGAAADAHAHARTNTNSGNSTTRSKSSGGINGIRKMIIINGSSGSGGSILSKSNSNHQLQQH